MPVLPYKETAPKLGREVYIAETAIVTGDVEIGDESSIWFGTVMRGDVHSIRIGSRTNIQDNSVVHVTGGVSGTIIGDEVTIGHGAIIHACTIQDRSLIGMGAIILDEAVVESEAMVAGGALLTPGKTVPTGELWGGSPARFMRKLSDEERSYLKKSADNYVEVAKNYQKGAGK